MGALFNPRANEHIVIFCFIFYNDINEMYNKTDYFILYRQSVFY